MSQRSTIAERTALGVKARDRAAISAIADWRPAAGRPDPIALLIEQASSREADLVPVRHGRMSVSPFAFYRGAALPMAADLAGVPMSGLRTQLSGDAHLSNFGLFASPERDLDFDVTDFDETLVGPWEWDVLRLTASLVVAARMRGIDVHGSRHVARSAVASYQARMAAYAGMRAIDIYYARVDSAAILEFVKARARPYLQATIKSAVHHDALHELPKITEVAGGRRRIADRPPTISHPPGLTLTFAESALVTYRDSLQEDRRVLLDRYALVDAARKVVGIGSVGLGAYVALLDGSGPDDPLFLQVKEAEASVLERFLEPSPFPTHGERIVTGQRRLQAASDILLGWTIGERGRHLYVRQLQDDKGSAVVEAMTVDDLTTWGELCGWSLARGHANAGDPVAISGYLGDGDEYVHAAAAFAATYADQTERDHTAFLEAIRTGRIAAELGV